MRVLLQRVTQASVSLPPDPAPVASIQQGLLALVGVFPDDATPAIEWLADKVLGLRIFADEDGAMNLSLTDIGGELLVVSQFTLAAQVDKGRRPGFSSAAAPDIARQRFDEFVAALTARGQSVQTGRFGADMQVALTNDGPATFLLER